MGVDLADYYRGKVSLRRMLVLADHLPPRGAVAQALAPDAVRWSETDHLLALAIDTLHAANGSQYRVPRPGSPEEKAALDKAERIRATRARSRDAFDQRMRLAREGRAG